ncbi:glycoside hydrolase/deacetylase beta/alpha-barrel [Lucifera butyrica]|uniref:Glycoside hydrolase/deacetylase beta/alpha-barrel n=1 Tax=Lucifera butyrica TaxID=1351585 RepID=A0A498R9N9_9FIRM|nr:hopanoid biosynthesis-associated protein HpnK [Lucifera butyrica]VBB06853.1 glycoside hydrolase/deacetylase beta/alpha-barrel [Lucifera butyrica]
MKQIIINADDFGLHEKVNLGIIEGYKNGCITSTSLMAGGPAFQHAVDLTGGNPGLGVGVHLTLVGAQPVAPAGEIASLVNEDGNFAAGYGDFFKQFFAGRIRLKDVRLELTAQIEKIRAGGVAITHVDSHQHLHILPGIFDIVLDLCDQYSIPAMRIPDEAIFFFGGYPRKLFRTLARNGLTFLAGRARKRAKRRGLAIPDHFFGMLAGGNMQAEYLLNIVRRLPDGTAEIMIHPGLENQSLNERYGWNYHWQEELDAVRDPRLRYCVDQNHIRLLSFRELAHEQIL